MPVSTPHVSVIVPVYNGEQFLAEAIASVLEQAHVPLEIIVVDDGSTDGTARVAAGFGQTVTYLHQANQGPAAARNRGLALAQGELLAFLDADDRWPPDKLARQVAALQASPDWLLVVGHIQFLRLAADGAPGEERYEVEPERSAAMLVGCMVASRAAFDLIGGFDPALRMSEDTDWFVRAREHGVAIPVLPETVLYYRRHGKGATRGLTAQDLPLPLVLKRSLDRRRQGGQPD